MKFYRTLPAIQAMTFDLDDTLYDNRPVIERLEQALDAWMVVHHPIATTHPKAWWGAFKRSLAQEYPELKHDVTQWRFETIAQGLQLLGYDPMSARQAAEDNLQEMFYWRNQVTVPEETHRVLKALACQIPLGAITNGNVDADKIGLGGYFQFVLKAGPDGAAKPEADLFEKASALLSVPHEQILHIGDHPRTDVLGAKQHGFRACWLNNQTQHARQHVNMRLLPDIEISHLSQLLSLPMR